MNRFILSRSSYIRVLIALLLFVGGCAAGPDLHRSRLENLPQHYAQFDLELAWQIKDMGAQTVIDGELKNARYAFMDNIEVWVATLDPSGKPAARSVSYIVPHELLRDELASFTVKLPVKAEPGAKLRFTYRYVGSDGGGRNMGGAAENWMQSFDTMVPSR